MRRLYSFTAVLLFLAGASRATVPQSTATPPSEAQMQTFTSTEGRFSVLLPGVPKQESQTVALKDNGSTTLYQFWVETQDGNVTYMAMYSDYPADYANDGAQNVLARTRDGAVKNKTLTSDVAIDLNGVPGRAFTCADKEGWHYSVHQFFAGKRLYQLIVVSNEGHPATLADQFMNSFRIL